MGRGVTRIALVAHWDWVLWRFRMPLARALRERGVDAILACPEGEYVPRMEAAGFRVIPWSVSRRGMNPASEALAIERLTRIYSKERPDLAHHFTIKPNLYGSIAARMAGVPAVVNTFTGMGYAFSPAGERARAAAVAGFRALRGRARTRFVFQTEGDRETAERWGLADPGTSVVIPSSGVDVETFHPGPERQGVPVALAACRLLWDKGVGDLVEAARLLDERGVEVRLRIAGAPDPGNPACIPESTLEGWRREGRVELLGHREDMAELLREADLAVLASRHEGVPRFLLEAAATGLPMVATDLEGCRAVVEEGVTGRLVPPGEAVPLAEAIAGLARDAGARVRMGREARARVERSFTEAAVVARTLEVYGALGVTVGPCP